METLILVVSSIITALGILFSVKNLYKEKIKITKMIIFVIVMAAIIFIQYKFASNFTRLIINYVGMLFFIYFLLVDRDIHKSVSYSSIIFLCTAIIEVVLTIILKSIINFDELYNKYYITLHIFNLLVNILLVLSTRIKFIVRLSNKIKISNVILKILLFLIILLSCLIGIQNKNIINTGSLSYIINILMFFFILLIAYVIADINNKNNEINNKYNQMMEYMTEYETIIDEQGKKNHEYKNQLMILNGFVDDKKKMKEYLNTIIDDHKTGENYEIRQLSHFPNGGLKGLLYYKLAKMKENDIKYYLYVSKEVKKPLEKLDLKNYKDISKIFGVLIDNAIDASISSDNKEIIIDFKMDDYYLVITITNSLEKDLDVSKLGTGYTTKGKYHGYGLRLVKDIIRSNNNLELLTDKNEKEFVQTLIIDTK